MHIKAAADLTGLTTKSIRYYENIGLVEPLRDLSGYRFFKKSDVDKLCFIAKSRYLGFTIEECRELLTLYENPNRASANVKAIANRHLNEISRKLTELSELKATLEPLVQNCAGDHAPDCPIIDELATKPKGQLTGTSSESVHAI